MPETTTNDVDYEEAELALKARVESLEKTVVSLVKQHKNILVNFREMISAVLAVSYPGQEQISEDE